MNNKAKIIELLKQHRELTVSLLVEELDISRQAIHRSLNSLQVENKVIKTGKPPKVFYSLVGDFTPPPIKAAKTEESLKRTIDDRFMSITPFGSKLMGWEGFSYWCQERQMDIAKTADSYLKTLKKYDQYKNDGLIDGMAKLKLSFKEVYLDKIYYLDFYSLEIFGKTKLGQLLLFAKQSQDRSMINEIADNIAPQINKLIKENQITAVGFIPPTVKRQLQLMKQLQKRLNLSIKTMDIVKLKTAVAVPQKTLSKIDDRVVNAKTTIAINNAGKFNNVLLIDDAVGSGATLNETAKKIRQDKLCKGKIIGVAIVGSVKGFEVISEV